MFAKLTSMTNGWHDFIVGDMARTLKTLHGVMTGVSKSAMPKVEGGGDDMCFGGRGTAYWVEWSGAIASKNLDPCGKCLHRKTPRVKFYRNKIISGKFANGKKIFDDMWNDKNIVKI